MTEMKPIDRIARAINDERVRWYVYRSTLKHSSEVRRCADPAVLDGAFTTEAAFDDPDEADEHLEDLRSAAIARAALLAMRKPTPYMVDRGLRARHDFHRLDECWTTMVDAAIHESAMIDKALED